LLQHLYRAGGDLMSDTEMLAVLNPDAFVTHMYETVFGRAPDAEGFAWWVDQL